jgi:recombination protein RecR
MAQAIDTLVAELSRLPGVGARSARRLALHLLRQPETRIPPLIAALEQARKEVRICAVCGMLDDQDPCRICANDTRDHALICVVEDVADVWAMERSRAFRGVYHVLGGTLSAIDGRGPETLNVAPLLARVTAGKVGEVILALGATVAGQTTAHYVAERLAAASSSFPPPSPPAGGGREEGFTRADASVLIPPAGGGDERGGIKITRLAQGIPVGGELDYLDDGTLTAALQARRAY